jgi:uncharacterized membrane-anchored protein
MSLTLTPNLDDRRRPGADIASFGAMRPDHAPTPSLKYWTALCIASVLGCNAGDLFSGAFGMLGGLPLLAAGFAATRFAERGSARPTEAYYWTGALLVRIAATNLADFLGHQFGIAVALAGMATALGGTLLLGHSPKVSATAFPRGDGLYWTRMLIAGALGTALGDFASSMSGLGPIGVTLALAAVVAALIAARSAGRLASTPAYWLIVVAIGTAGTVFGDLSASYIGLAQSAMVSAWALAAILFFRTRRPVFAPVAMAQS